MNYDSAISKRKEEHIQGAIELLKVSSQNYFDKYRIIHNALPEINLEDVNTSRKFLGRMLKAPLMIASITGGAEVTKKINKNLAKAAQQAGVPFAMGSAKIAIKNPSVLFSFKVRKFCPDVPLLANLGIVDLDSEFSLNDCRELIKKLEADALIFHINPLHEALQNEGNTRFAGVLERLRRLINEFDFPILVKEVGHGINAEVFKKIDKTGVYAIDIAGSGGTSWGKIESNRAKNSINQKVCQTFADWGIPTIDILENLRGAQKNAQLIASGGIRSGLHIFKALCLGADLTAAALPLLQPSLQSAEIVIDVLEQFISELRLAMFSTGCQKLEQLNYQLLKVKDAL